MTKISQLSSIGANLENLDEFVIRDFSDAVTPNKKVTASGVLTYIISNYLDQASSSTSDANIAVDAATVDIYSHIASFSANRVVQVSNLIAGRSVKMYLRNTNATGRALSISASTTTAGFTGVNLAPGGGTVGAASVSGFTLSGTSGTALVWVGNVNGSICGGILA
jgi:hypothetical protein